MTKEIKIKLEKGDEVLERKITKFSNSSHVILPAKHEGKTAKVIINKIRGEKGSPEPHVKHTRL